MFDWAKNLLAAIGGGTVVLVGVLTIFKSLITKMFETGIESSFEKNIEKFKNKLQRSTRAYEILLDREMRYYEKLEPIIAELVPLEHDLCYYLKHHKEEERETRYEKFGKHMMRYCELIIDLKNENLVHQSYIPQKVFVAYTAVVKQMQDDLTWWTDMEEFFFNNECEKIDYEKCEKVVYALLEKIALAETIVRSRLKELCGEE